MNTMTIHNVVTRGKTFAYSASSQRAHAGTCPLGLGSNTKSWQRMKWAAAVYVQRLHLHTLWEAVGRQEACCFCQPVGQVLSLRSWQFVWQPYMTPGDTLTTTMLYKASVGSSGDSPGAAAPTPHSSLEETLNCTQRLMKTKIQFPHPSEWDCQNSTPNPRSQTPLQLARLQLYYCTLLCEATSWFPGFHIVFWTPYQGGGAALQGPLGWSYHLLKPGVSDLGLAPPQWCMWNLKKGSFQATVDACPVPGGCMIMSLQVTQSKEAWGAA